nr:nitrogenase iron-molybdenum cofactor biosynthesis protein NifN [Chromatium okenii]
MAASATPPLIKTPSPVIIKRKKALSVSPLKASSTVGAALAFLGFNRAIPMLHGAQGCSAFGKILFVRHFREPIPLQTTAVDHVTAIMGGDALVIEGLKTLCEKHQPALIGVPTTGLVEAQGADIHLAVREFRQRYPQFNATPVVAVSAPDFSGGMESGYAAATRAIIEILVPTAAAAGTRPGRRQRQINVLAGAQLTPGDLEHLKELIELFGLRPLVLPDLSDALDGHLPASDYSALTIGGTLVSELATVGDALATVVIGGAMNAAADALHERTGVPDHRFAHLMGISAVDALIATLATLAAVPVPAKIVRQREQLQDAMLDSHFMLGQARLALAAEPDLLVGLTQMLAGVGATTVAAVSPTNAPALAAAVCEQVQIGDLEDLELTARANRADVLITNSHGVHTGKRLGIPLLRAGFPQYDTLGGYTRTWIGYSGTRATLFELANLLLSLEKGEIHPYRSALKQWSEAERHVAAHSA